MLAKVPTKPKIIYIDDEEKALEYFKDAYDDEYDILTATSAEEGWEKIQQYANELAIIITDQRMPGDQGVDLLVKAHEAYPRTMRLLATAYADIQSAIASVNDGFVYHYITKPWDETELRVVLRRTLDYWKLVRDRDILIKEKIIVLKRMAIIDRVKSLTVLAASLSHSLHNPIAAAYSFTAKMLHYLETQGHSNSKTADDLQTLDLVNQGIMTQIKLDDIIAATQKISQTTLPPLEASLDDTIEIETIIINAKKNLLKAEATRAAKRTLSIHDTTAKNLSLRGNQKMVKKLIPLLLESLCHDFSDDLSIVLNTIQQPLPSGEPGCRITILAESKMWTQNQIKAMFSIFKDLEDVNQSLALLTALFLTHHHGGDIKVINKPERGAGYDILLPLDPQKGQPTAIEDNFLEKIITSFEEDDIAAL